MSIGEEFEALFDAGLLTYEQVFRFANACGGVFDQWPKPGCGWDNPSEQAPDPDLDFTSYWQFVDYSYMDQCDDGPAIVGSPPNGHVHLVFRETAEQMVDVSATILHLLQRIKNGEPAEPLTPKLHAARACE